MSTPELRTLAKALARYPSAVLSLRDEEGYPFSLRCRPTVDLARGRVDLHVVGRLPLDRGPASLLCHAHDDQLWNQTSFLVRGRLVRTDRGYEFGPLKLVPGIEQGVLPFVRFVIASRRAAERYLRRRGLARPSIPWDDVARCAARAER